MEVYSKNGTMVGVWVCSTMVTHGKHHFAVCTAFRILEPGLEVAAVMQITRHYVVIKKMIGNLLMCKTILPKFLGT